MKLIISIYLFYVFILYLLLSGVSVVLGSVYQSNAADPENTDNCLVEGKSFPPGTHTNPSETSCYRVECDKGGHAVVAGCGVEGHENPKCKNDGLIDPSLPYPDCCAVKWKCSDD